MHDLGERLLRLPAETVAALAFFSRLPVRAPASAFDLRRSAAAWPLAGLVLALCPAFLFWVARALDLPPLVAALLALALLVALTGGLHEDGLADTADGLAGGKTRESKLEIMRDSRLGTFGGLALLFVVLLKAAALASLGLRPGTAALALVLAAIVSRAMALWHWNITLPARSDGLAFSAGRPDWQACAIGLGIGGLAALGLLFLFGWTALFALLVAAVAVALFSGQCNRQIGGHTGDTVGASQQIAEALLLACLSAAWP
jgi:adenosylcobinamide-GDP ribazoletransferase